MTFNTAGLLQAVDAILTNVTGVQDTQIGVPSAFEARASAYCAVAGQTFPPQLEMFGGAQYGHLTRSAGIIVGFAYATGTTAADPTDHESIATAELTLAAWIDSFIRKVLTDAPLKALCEDVSLDLGMNNLPEYRDWGGREVRHWFAIISCDQSEDI